MLVAGDAAASPESVCVACAELARHLGREALDVGVALSRRLLDMEPDVRTGAAARALADMFAAHGFPLVVVHLEFLFEPSLHIHPLAALRQAARAGLVVAAWPGTVRGAELVYARPGHPEHRIDSTAGLHCVRLPAPSRSDSSRNWP